MENREKGKREPHGECYNFYIAFIDQFYSLTFKY